MSVEKQYRYGGVAIMSAGLPIVVYAVFVKYADVAVWSAFDGTVPSLESPWRLNALHVTALIFTFT